MDLPPAAHYIEDTDPRINGRHSLDANRIGLACPAGESPLHGMALGLHTGLPNNGSAHRFGQAWQNQHGAMGL